MSTWQVVVVVVVVVVVLLALAAALSRRQSARRRSDHLRERFGPEYDAALRRNGSQREAEGELDLREQQRRQVDVRALDPVRAQQFASQWQGVQSRFVDDPEGSVRQADDLVTQVMDERGYPTGDHARQYEDVSVDHPDLAADYRTAHGIAGASRRGEATTEQLREAMVHYRSLFGRLLGDQADPSATAAAPVVPGTAPQRPREAAAPGPLEDGAGTRAADQAGPADLREDPQSLGASRIGRHERRFGDDAYGGDGYGDGGPGDGMGGDGGPGDGMGGDRSWRP